MYFDNCTTLEELKATYKKLCFKNHPDLGGSVEVMQSINNEYEKMHQRLAFNFNANEDNKFTYDWTKDKFRDVINSIIHFDRMDIEIIGSWIWCFNAYEYHEQLKELGFWFSGAKKAWVFSGSKKKNIRSRSTMADLRKKWGSEEIKTTRQSAIA